MRTYVASIGRHNPHPSVTAIVDKRSPSSNEKYATIDWRCPDVDADYVDAVIAHRRSDDAGVAGEPSLFGVPTSRELFGHHVLDAPPVAFHSFSTTTSASEAIEKAVSLRGGDGDPWCDNGCPRGKFLRMEQHGRPHERSCLQMGCSTNPSSRICRIVCGKEGVMCGKNSVDAFEPIVFEIPTQIWCRTKDSIDHLRHVVITQQGRGWAGRRLSPRHANFPDSVAGFACSRSVVSHSESGFARPCRASFVVTRDDLCRE